MNSKLLRGSAIATVSVLAGGLFSIVGGGIASAAPETKSVAFTTACHVREMDGVASPITFNETLGSGVTITAPTTAAPGETVTYRVQPNEMKTNSGGHASRGVVHWARIKYDFDIPSGVEFVSSQLVADSAYGLGSDSATDRRRR